MSPHETLDARARRRHLGARQACATAGRHATEWRGTSTDHPEADEATTLDELLTRVRCAQCLGRAAHAGRVVVGAMTRTMAVIWRATFSIVDARTGNVFDEFRVGYKGDVQAM